MQRLMRLLYGNSVQPPTPSKVPFKRKIKAPPLKKIPV